MQWGAKLGGEMGELFSKQDLLQGLGPFFRERSTEGFEAFEVFDRR